MLSVSNLLCGHRAGNERLRYGHTSPHDKAESKGIPRPVVVWAVTRACNLRCVHCYASADAAPAPGELTHSVGRALLEDLRCFQVPAILFSGGEPLSRPDLPELMAYARELGLRATLSTNGLLIDDARADRLAALGLEYAGISLDGRRTVHDRLRGEKGAFDRSLQAIERCRLRGIKVGVRLTIHALNVDELDAMFDLCVERGVQRLCIYHLAYAGRGDSLRRRDLTAAQTRAVVSRIFERTRQLHNDGKRLEVLTVGNHADAAYLLLEIEKESPALAEKTWQRLLGTGGNQSGCFIASVGPTGEVHYDQFSWHYSCGNVKREPFSQIWSAPKDSRLSLLRDRRSYLPARCRSCRFLGVCNGNLRTRAEAASGNWLGLDPACYLTDSEIRRSPSDQG